MHDTVSPPFPPALVRQLSEIEWLEPWWCFCLEDGEFGQSFEEELRKELSSQHTLYPYRQSARAIAKREDRDDFLFWLPQADQMFAIVHLTFKGGLETDPNWPSTSMLNSLAEFVELELVPANREWLCI